MQRLVKSTSTGEFLSSEWKWTGDLAYARQFRDVAEVIAAVRLLDGTEVEMVVMPYDTPSALDLSLPLNVPSWPGAVR